MNFYSKSSLTFSLIYLLLLSGNVLADDQKGEAFPERYMIRISGYFVDRATTDITVLSNAGIGTGINFKNDLGGEDTDSIPRIDAYYRFNKNHRLDFSTFRVDRSGRIQLSGELAIGDQIFNVNETVFSEIKYTTYKLGYAYSFYHSPQVELSLLAGLNFTNYDIGYRLDDGAKSSSNDVTAPLPTFGLSMGYLISPNWSIHYKSESFFIELDDALKGAFLSYELNVEYKIFQYFTMGLGLTRLSTNVAVKSDDWKGSVDDSHRGILLYGAFYF